MEALSRVAAGLPADLPASIFMVVHIPADATSVLPRILSRAGPTPAVHPADGDPIERGRIYIAPPGHHLIVGQGHVHVTRGPRENGHRPAVDPLFRSAARSYGERVVGVVLSGNLDDGTAGLQIVRARGGQAVVQDPETAVYTGMPQSALEHVKDAHSVTLDEIAPLLVRLSGGEPSPDAEGKTRPEEGVQMSESTPEAARAGGDGAGEGGGFGLSCPECSGNHWQEDDGSVVHFRCRVGHAYAADSLLAATSEGVEAVLWSALNALEEKAGWASGGRARISSAC